MIGRNTDKIEEIKRLASATQIQDLLTESCGEDLLYAFDKLVRDSLGSRFCHFGYVKSPEIADKISPDTWTQIRKYCHRRFNNDLLPPPHLLAAILYIYAPDQVHAWIGTDVLRHLDGHLMFDNDGLLVGPGNHIVFNKEGVLTSDLFIQYDHLLPGTGLSGGFLDDLLRFVETLSSSPSYLGFAVCPDSVLGREFYSECYTRAYIRGPQGISEELLQKESFPEDSSGTVTQHNRLSDDPLLALFPLKRTEFMWSRRGSIKSVQIEELRDPSAINCSRTEAIQNRYVHARWDCERRAFIHFDGAVRGYNRDVYEERLVSDIKKFDKKASSYKKLFRIDTEIDLHIWCKLVAKFYQDNELVLEYLGNAEPDRPMDV